MAWKCYDYLQAKEEARRLNDQRTTEERIRLEKERQIQLEKERQAVLEEKRRKQAEADRLERERQVYLANMPVFRKVHKFSDARKLCCDLPQNSNKEAKPEGILSKRCK